MDRLRGFFASWLEDKQQADIVYAMLTCIGYIRRAGIDMKFLRELRKIETNLRNELENIVSEYGKFMAASTLPARCKKLAEIDDKDYFIDFYQDRDEAELALQLVTEYVDEEKTSNWRIIGQVRDLMDKVDDHILLHQNVVSKLREIGEVENAVYFDVDFFWWLPADRGECYLPTHRGDEYIAAYVQKKMSQKMRDLFLRHLWNCESCGEQAMRLEALLAE